MIASTNNKFQDSKKWGLDRTHITLGAAVPSSGLTIELPTYSEGITVADKDNNYSYFANTDPSRIHPLDPDYEVVLNNDGTELVLGVTE